MAAESDGTSQAGIASTSVPPTLLTLATDNLPLAIGYALTELYQSGLITISKIRGPLR